jgi:cytidylate kinase
LSSRVAEASCEKQLSSKKRKKIVICICGMSACGKSTLAKGLAEKYGLRYFSGGEALKVLAVEAGFKPIERGWWESEEGFRFLRLRERDSSFDRRIDEKLLEVAKAGDVVLDSWTMPWLLKEDGFKVWLECDEKVRVKRLAKRNNMSFDNALRALRDKEAKTRQIYKRLYGFDLGWDFGPFDLVLDVSDLSVDEAFQAVSLVVENLLLRK